MNAQALVLRLFGIPVLRLATGQDLVFAAERPFQMLAYLACRRGWVARDEIATWLWPDRPQPVARSNLRKVLLLATKIPDLPPIEQQGDRLRWCPHSDLQAFEAACDEHRLAEALALYRPPLLQSLDAGLPPPAAEWLEFEREGVNVRWRAAAAAQLQQLADTPQATIALAVSLLAHDPFDETALTALANAHVAMGDVSTALRALATHAEQLRMQLGVEPSTELRALDAQLRRRVQPRAVSTHPTAATPPSTFIGRRLELTQLREWLVRDHRRVVTISGPGGMGKSELARIARTALADAFDQRAWWLPLDDLDDDEQVGARLVGVVGLALSGNASPWQQLAEHIGADAALLVVDNAEHLPLLMPRLATLLATCAGLQVLATSRARLALPGETLLPLDGLPLPDRDEADIDLLRNNDAVRLFEQRALAADPAFALAAHADAVVELVHSLEGLPLAIELAASWVRLLPVRQIVDDLKQSLDLLGVPTAGMQPRARDRGLRGSFDHSWRLLSQAERAGIVRLALLPAPIDRAIALQVAQAPLPLLAALVDKSLLRPDGHGSFLLHPLIRACAVERTYECSVDRSALDERHAGYVSHWLERFDNRRVLQAPAMRHELEVMLGHVHAAWRWALAQQDAALAARVVWIMAEYYRLCGLWQEGIAACGLAADAFSESPAAHARAKGIALYARASLQFHGGDGAAAEPVARQALRIATRIGDSSTASLTLLILAYRLVNTSKPTEARRLFSQLLRRAERDGDVNLTGVAHNSLGIVDHFVGDFDSARSHYLAAIPFFRAAGNFDGLAAAVSNVGYGHFVRREWDEALASYREAMELCDAHELSSARTNALVNVAFVLLEMQRHDEAHAMFERARAAAQAYGEHSSETYALRGMAEIAVVQRNDADARAHLRAAALLAQRSELPELQLSCILTRTTILVACDDLAQARTLLRWLASHDEANAEDRQKARERLATLPEGRLTDAEPSLAHVIATIIAAT